MKQSFILTLIVGLTSISASAQYRAGFSKYFTPGVVKMLDGTEIECEIGFPIDNQIETNLNLLNLRDYSRLKIKHENGEKENLNPNDVDYMIFQTKDGEAFLKRLPYYMLRSKGRKAVNAKAWFQLTAGCKDKDLGYLFVAKYDINRKKEAYAYYYEGMGDYAIQRAGEDGPTLVTKVFITKNLLQKSYDKRTRKSLQKFYKDDKEVLNFLKDKERLTIEELEAYLDSKCE